MQKIMKFFLKRFKFLFIFSFSSFLFIHEPAYAVNETVKTKGSGSTEITALNDAKKNAITKVCGETLIGSTNLKSETEKNTTINTDGASSKSLNASSKSIEEDQSLVGGLIKSFKIISKKNNGEIFNIEIEANITECKKSEAIQNALTGQALFAQLQKINSELKQLGSTNSIIGKPTTLAQKYHNGRMLSQRGEVDLALKAYEELMKEKIIFADPIQDMKLLSKRIYGLEGSKKYLEKALSPIKGRPEYLYAFLSKDEKPIPENWNIVQENIENFPPLGYSYLNNWLLYCGTIEQSKIISCYREMGKLENINKISKNLVDKIKSGENLNYYIDSIKAEVDSESFEFQFGKNLYDMKVLTKP